MANLEIRRPKACYVLASSCQLGATRKWGFMEIFDNQGNINLGEVSRRDLLRGAGALAIMGGVVSTIGASPLNAMGRMPAIKKGGSLRVGVVGDIKDRLDAHWIVSIPDIVRLNVGFETLMTYDESFQPTYADGLAEEVTTTDGVNWIIRVKKGIEFHDGKTLNGDDLVYSWQRLSDPKAVHSKSLRPFLNPAGVSKVDDRTVKLTLLQANSDFRVTLATYTSTMVPVGYENFGINKTQVGTGPYKLKSFTPGVESTHVRNANYWDKGKPHLDEVRILSFSDTTALTNALQGGQIDVAINVPLAMLPTLKKDKKLDVYSNSAGKITPICLVIDMDPFKDVRTRQAMKMLIDRKKLLKQVLSNNGRLSNDDYSPADPNYNANGYPMQEQDIKGALKLLSAVGFSKSNPVVFDLKAPDDDAALSGLAKAFVEQVNTASGGVVKATATTVAVGYWDTTYMAKGVNAFMTYYNPKPYFPQFSGMVFSYPETHFPEPGSQAKANYYAALAEVGPNRRAAIIKRMQKEEHERGGYIIPYFVNASDSYTKKLQGVNKRNAALPLDYYGMHFKNLWLA